MSRPPFPFNAIVAALLWLCVAPLRADDEFVGVSGLAGHSSQASGVSADGNVMIGQINFDDSVNDHLFHWSNGAIIDLGNLGGWTQAASAVSANGTVVVGFSYLSDNWRYRAFRWTAAGGMVDLGTLGGNHSAANAVSADGGVVVGYGYLADDTAHHAFRWENGSMADLGTLGGTHSSAEAVSADGAVVAGYSDLAGDSAGHAFRWKDGNMTDLGTLGGGVSYATAISASGAVVVGNSQITDNAADHAFRWENGSMADLGTLGGTNSYAYAVSADGAVAVGYSQVAGDAAEHAYRWTSAGMADLGTLGGDYSRAHAVSADGSVIVGISARADTPTWDSFRWTEGSGMQAVVDWLSVAGVTLPAGWRLYNGFSNVLTNRDGSVVVGTGVDPNGNSQAWLARVGGDSGAAPGIILDMAAFNATVFEAGNRGIEEGVVITNLALFGSHHRTLLDFAGLARGKNGSCAWATADVERRGDADTQLELAEAGVCTELAGIAKTTRIGAGVGQTWARQGWALGGGAKYSGQYLVVEAASAFEGGLEASVLGYYARFSTELRRNYMNGTTVDTSAAKPDASSTALRLRLDWKGLGEPTYPNISPYLVYTRTETRLEAYTETGGSFPAAFDATTTRSNDVRLGAALKYEVSARLDLKFSLELAHRFESNVGASNGRIIGLGSFTAPGQTLKQDWVRGIFDLDYRLNRESAFTMSFKSSTVGNDPSWGWSVGYRRMF